MKESQAKPIDVAELQRIMALHLPMYRKKSPTYQAKMLQSLQEVWIGHHRSLLDVGGGTGVIAEAISQLFQVEDVCAVDVVDRFCPSLAVTTQTFDGRRLPFDDGQFDAATLNNVMHHVAIDDRADLLREIRRVVAGPLYVKDHESRGRADDLRLTILDAVGNIPFGGMVTAEYLSPADWKQLALDSGYTMTARADSMRYRQGPLAKLFPNRLEVTMRFEAA